jgi:hypothetical protein
MNLGPTLRVETSDRGKKELDVMKKNLLILATAAVMLGALPAGASAKERGCDYRLSGITQAEVALTDAQKRGIGITEARAQLDRARSMAIQEGCVIQKARWDGDRDRHERWDERKRVRARFDYLIAAGYRRGLSRVEFRELMELDKRFDR